MSQKYNYITVEESQSINYFKIPKQLFTEEFKTLSTDAKLLYGLMLERTGLSKKNNWVNEEGNVFIIYTIESIQEELGRGKTSITKYLSELEEIGLIERVRQGLSKPNLIYVKSLVQKVNIKKSNKRTSRSSESEHQDVQNVNTNKTEINKTENSKTENISPIVPFDKFWKAYPKKVGIAKARKSFEKMVKDEPTLNQILLDLRRRKEFEQWKDHKYIPNPTTYLNQERWKDEYDIGKKSSSSAYESYKKKYLND